MYSYEVELSGDERALRVDLEPRGNAWEVTAGGASHRIRLLGGAPGGRVLVEIDGHTLELEPETLHVRPVPAPPVKAAAPRKTPGAPASAPRLALPSPMAGVVQDLLVQPGHVVRRGDRVLVIEAMKMENSIVAPASGRIAAVAVNPRTTVLKGQMLLELEPLAEEVR